MKVWICVCALAVACSGSTINTKTTQGGVKDEEDTTPPVIEHEPIDGSQRYGDDVAIIATAVDDDTGVFLVTVIYKQETSTEWVDAPLSNQGDGNYVGRIPGADVGSGGMDYYLSALDLNENESFLPSDGEADPYHFRVSAD